MSALPIYPDDFEDEDESAEEEEQEEVKAPDLRDLMYRNLEGKRPELTLLRVGDLVVDKRYQRLTDELSRAHIERIKADFDWSLFFCIGVNRRDTGELYVYDGQHRVTAVLELFGPEVKVPAVVSIGYTAQEEARLFRAMGSNRIPVTPIQKFKAQIFAGDPAPLDILRIVEEHGFKITANHRTGEVIRSVSTIERLYYPARGSVGKMREAYGSLYEKDPSEFGPRWMGRERLNFVLGVCALAWDYQEPLTSRVLEAVATIWSARGEVSGGIDRDLLAKTLRFRTPKGWDVLEKEKRVPLWVLVAESYNRGLRGRKRIPTAEVREDSRPEAEPVTDPER